MCVLIGTGQGVDAAEFGENISWPGYWTKSSIFLGEHRFSCKKKDPASRKNILYPSVCTVNDSAYGASVAMIKPHFVTY